MVRLLQGDVGCGKTIVALHAIAAAADGGYQTAIDGARRKFSPNNTRSRCAITSRRWESRSPC